jgi:hypothetical protein
MVQDSVSLSIEKQLNDVWMKLYHIESDETLSLEEMLSSLEMVSNMLQAIQSHPAITDEHEQKRQRMERWFLCYNLADIRSTIEKEKKLQLDATDLETN